MMFKTGWSNCYTFAGCFLGGTRKSGNPLLGKTHIAFVYRRRMQRQPPDNLSGHPSRCTLKHNMNPLSLALFSSRGTHSRLQLLPFFRHEIDFFSFTTHDKSIYHNAYDGN